MKRVSYHHGNLRAAILETSLVLARADGMNAVVAREVAREVGVTPAAIYRHFSDIEHLHAEVSQAAREQLAQSMIDARSGITKSRDAKKLAVRSFEATGYAYVKFAMDEPGLFTAAFAQCQVAPARDDDPNAWDILNHELDALVVAGVLPPARRREAPVIAWTSVHGLAQLLLSRATPPEMPPELLIASVLGGVQRALEMP